MTCRADGCTNEALPNMSRCAEHLLRWQPAKPVERPPESAWVRRAREGKLPPKILGMVPA